MFRVFVPTRDGRTIRFGRYNIILRLIDIPLDFGFLEAGFFFY